MIAELARRRWAIEKVFDQLKNKMAETKAWATTPTAKTMQAIFICITHQLLRALEHLLETHHDIRPERELRRRRNQIAAHEQTARENNRGFPSLRVAAVRLTQHTVKFLRWLLILPATRGSLARSYRSPPPFLRLCLSLSFNTVGRKDYLVSTCRQV